MGVYRQQRLLSLKTVVIKYSSLSLSLSSHSRFLSLYISLYIHIYISLASSLFARVYYGARANGALSMRTSRVWRGVCVASMCVASAATATAVVSHDRRHGTVRPWRSRSCVAAPRSTWSASAASCGCWRPSATTTSSLYWVREARRERGEGVVVRGEGEGGGGGVVGGVLSICPRLF